MACGCSSASECANDSGVGEAWALCVRECEADAKGRCSGGRLDHMTAAGCCLLLLALGAAPFVAVNGGWSDWDALRAGADGRGGEQKERSPRSDPRFTRHAEPPTALRPSRRARSHCGDTTPTPHSSPRHPRVRAVTRVTLRLRCAVAGASQPSPRASRSRQPEMAPLLAAAVSVCCVLLTAVFSKTESWSAHTHVCLSGRIEGGGWPREGRDGKGQGERTERKGPHAAAKKKKTITKLFQWKPFSNEQTNARAESQMHSLYEWIRKRAKERGCGTVLLERDFATKDLLLQLAGHSFQSVSVHRMLHAAV